jgi:hypothetical protein
LAFPVLLHDLNLQNRVEGLVGMRGGGDYDSVLVGDAPCTVGEYLPEECIEGDGEDSEEEVVFTRDQHRAT